MSDDKVVIVSAKRTPIGSFQGNFESLKATQLGSRVIEKNINEKALFVKNVVHNGSSKYCLINDSIMFCNGFVLPFVANVRRTRNSLYGSCHTNRIKIKELWRK